MSVELMVEVWNLVKPYIAKKDRGEIAECILNVFESHADMSHLMEYFDEMDSTFKELLEERVDADELRSTADDPWDMDETDDRY